MRALMRSLWRKADSDERKMLANASAFAVGLLAAMTLAGVLVGWMIWKQPAPEAAIRSGVPTSVSPLQQGKTPEGYRYGWIGEMPKTPKPTVLFLGGQVEYNISDPPQAKAVEILCKKVLCLTIDGPGEGADVVDQKVQGLEYWAQSLAARRDFIGDFVLRANAVLDKLEKDGAVDRERIGIFGTSRGAFIGFHLAASDSRIKAIAAFSPVTNLLAVSEFAQVKEAAYMLTAKSYSKFVNSLYQTPIWLTIGAADERVDTQEAINFSKLMINAAGSAPQVFELHVRPAIEHRTPEGAYAEAAEWMLKQLAPANTTVRPHTQ